MARNLPLQLGPYKGEQSLRLHILLSDEAYERLVTLKKFNECISFGEVIRRAIQILDRVIEEIGLPTDIDVTKSNILLSHRLQVLINHATLHRIQKFCQKQSFESKSDVVRVALELYGTISAEHREMREYTIQGFKGKMKSGLALVP